jgi:hypothetical protein
MGVVAGVIAAAGPWALALGVVLAGGWLVVSGKLIPAARHREVIDLYAKQADRLQAALDTRDAQLTEAMEHSRLAVQTWDSIRQEAGRPS